MKSSPRKIANGRVCMKYFRTAAAAELLKTIFEETRKGYLMVSTLMNSKIRLIAYAIFMTPFSPSMNKMMDS